MNLLICNLLSPKIPQRESLTHYLLLMNNKKHLTSAESSRLQFSYSMFTQLIRFVAVAQTVFRMMILEDICPL